MRSGTIRSIHIVAIGGSGTAPLACLLRARGYQVRGSDGPLYPPMSTLLLEHGIEPLVGFDPRHLEPRPDLVIIGNAVPRSNVEAQETERLGIERISMPQALDRFFLRDRRPLVVTGTHGKTTTTTLASWVWESCGRGPGYLIGGIPRDLAASFALGEGERFIIEGDEYNAAYFDRGPKFLHYRPETLIVTGVEHDHVDLYPDPGSFRDAFRRLVERVPEDGLLIADGDTAELREIAARASSRVVLYGFGESCDLRPLGEPDWAADRTRFEVDDRELGRVTIELRVPGEHNVRNALAVWAAARADGLPTDEVLDALREFRGARRRLELIGSVDGTDIIDDFAHHPTEAQKTLGALRQRYGKRRIVAAFEPRSITSGRRFFFDAYLEAFSAADVLILAPIHYAQRLSDDERIDLGSLVDELGDRGVEARACKNHDEVLSATVDAVQPGDVVVTMSSGNFENMPRRLVEVLDRDS